MEATHMSGVIARETWNGDLHALVDCFRMRRDSGPTASGYIAAPLASTEWQKYEQLRRTH